MHHLTWIGVFLILFGTAVTILGQQKLSDKSNDLLQLKGDKIAELNQENFNLAKLNAELLEQSLNQVRGNRGHAFYALLSIEGSMETFFSISKFFHVWLIDEYTTGLPLQFLWPHSK